LEGLTRTPVRTSSRAALLAKAVQIASSMHISLAEYF
jgi:hypothetical protein